MIPTVPDYHTVHRLQTFRVKTLQETLVHEELFPHGEFQHPRFPIPSYVRLGYGRCPAHNTRAEAAWDRARIILARKIETSKCPKTYVYRSEISIQTRTWLAKWKVWCTSSRAVVSAVKHLLRRLICWPTSAAGYQDV